MCVISVITGVSYFSFSVQIIFMLIQSFETLCLVMSGAAAKKCIQTLNFCYIVWIFKLLTMCYMLTMYLVPCVYFHRFINDKETIYNQGICTWILEVHEFKCSWNWSFWENHEISCSQKSQCANGDSDELLISVFRGTFLYGYHSTKGRGRSAYL